MEAINLRISYVDKKYPFVANPFAVFCLDSNERLYLDEYCVFFGNTKSPNEEIRFIRNDDCEEAFRIVFDDLPIEIEHIVVIVSGLDKYPSELLFEAKDDNGDYVRELHISVDMNEEKGSFSVARIIRSRNEWLCSIEFERINQSYIDWITRSRESEEFEILCGITERKGEALHDRIDCFKKNLQASIIYCDQILDIRCKLERVDWSKVPKDKMEEIFAKLEVYLNREKKIQEDLRKEFDSICDWFDDMIVGLCCYARNHRALKDKISELLTNRLIEYREFSFETKDMCGFERSVEKRKRRNDIIKMVFD